ncbi:MAG TPA: hypothetical protein PLO62_15860 [Candidatus Hydrogenedentes bacterium]|nr:hypothetical protein [Candidatus Hydrogenedentota bacterium]HOS01637.1 hypothetical protein [Candidatus Hydrogenedentota bacterium]
MGRIYSQVERIAVPDVASRRNSIETQCLTETEIEATANRHVQTVAGFVAVKRALCGVCARLGLGEWSERDFVLTHTANGAPRIAACPKRLCDENGAPMPGLYISIAHTKQHAYGLAVYQEE